MTTQVTADLIAKMKQRARKSGPAGQLPVDWVDSLLEFAEQALQKEQQVRTVMNEYALRVVYDNPEMHNALQTVAKRLAEALGEDIADILPRSLPPPPESVRRQVEAEESQLDIRDVAAILEWRGARTRQLAAQRHNESQRSEASSYAEVCVSVAREGGGRMTRLVRVRRGTSYEETQQRAVDRAIELGHKEVQRF